MDPTIQVDEIVMSNYHIHEFYAGVSSSFLRFLSVNFWTRSNPSALVNGSAVVKALIFHRPVLRLNVLLIACLPTNQSVFSQLRPIGYGVNVCRPKPKKQSAPPRNGKRQSRVMKCSRLTSMRCSKERVTGDFASRVMAAHRIRNSQDPPTCCSSLSQSE